MTVRWLSDRNRPFDRWIRDTLAVRLGLRLRTQGDFRGVVLAYGTPLPAGSVGLHVERAGISSWPELDRGDRFFLLQPLGPGRWRTRFDVFSLMRAALGGDLDRGSSPDCGGVFAVLRHEPILDRWLQWMREALVEASTLAGPVLTPLMPWGRGKRAAVFLSHDVDTLDGTGLLPLRFAFWLAALTRATINGDASARSFYLARIVRWATTAEDPHFTIPELMAMEQAHGVRSTFYFFGLRFPVSRFVGRGYSSWSTRLRDITRSLDAGGWEVGLHGCRRPTDVARSFRAGAALLAGALGHPVDGVRQHGLALSIPRTWDAQFAAGLEYDASFGWNTATGFRGGTAFPFQPPYADSSELPGLTVIPLVVMDGPLEREARNDIGRMQATVRGLFESVLSVGGCFSFLLHTTSLDDADHPGLRKVYEDLLGEICGRSDVLVATGRELCWMWKDHQRRVLGTPHAESDDHGPPTARPCPCEGPPVAD